MKHNHFFYSSISPWYDHVFPYKPDHYHFIVKHAGNEYPLKILDIGCATGSLALALAESGHQVYAIDNDGEMIKKACQKKHSSGFIQYPVFGKMDMTQVGDYFHHGDFRVISCFGNTLVHLPDEKTIGEMIRSVYRLLEPGGHFLLQILHYDYILKHHIRDLPVIENETIRFERHYTNHEDKRVDFDTVLHVKKDGREIRNRVKLYPLLKNRLSRMLQQAGFGAIHFYGSFQMDPHTPDSMPLIVAAKKTGN